MLCLLTTFRRTRSRSSPIGRRRQTWGLYLLSTLAAHDLGYVGTLDTVERLEATLGAMSQMELLRGHFYNWYDTRDLRPLNPKYVSSVDSGNLAGHLLALGNGCRELIQKSSLGDRSLAGVKDAIDLLREALGKIAETRRTNTVTRKQLSNAIDALANSLELTPMNAAEWAERLVELRARALTVADIAQTMAQERGDAPESELRAWADAVRGCVESHVRDAEILVPWVRRGFESRWRWQGARGSRAPEWAVIEPVLSSPRPPWPMFPNVAKAHIGHLLLCEPACSTMQCRTQTSWRASTP